MCASLASLKLRYVRHCLLPLPEETLTPFPPHLWFPVARYSVAIFFCNHISCVIRQGRESAKKCGFKIKREILPEAIDSERCQTYLKRILIRSFRFGIKAQRGSLGWQAWISLLRRNVYTGSRQVWLWESARSWGGGKRALIQRNPRDCYAPCDATPGGWS